MNDYLTIRVTPRAGRDQIDGARAGVLHVRVAAPPVDGRANAAVVRLLARALGVSPGRVRVVRGDAARDKQIAIDGLTAAEALARLTGEA